MTIYKPLPIQGISPVSGVQGVKPVQGVTGFSAVSNTVSDYQNPYAINSVTDVLFNVEGRKRKYGTTGLDSVIKAGVDFIKDSYVKPVLSLDIGRTVLNGLNAFSEDLDVLSNFTKAAIIEPQNEMLSFIVGGTAALAAGVATVATGGTAPILTAMVVGGVSAVGASVIDDPEGAARGIIKASGATEAGRTSYNFNADTGNDWLNFALNMTGEVVVDPLNWLSFGSMAARKAITGTSAFAAEGVAKSARQLTALDNSILKTLDAVQKFDTGFTKAVWMSNPLGLGLTGLYRGTKVGLSAMSMAANKAASEILLNGGKSPISKVGQVIDRVVSAGSNFQSAVRKDNFIELGFLGKQTDEAVFTWFVDEQARLVKAGVPAEVANDLLRDFATKYTLGAGAELGGIADSALSAYYKTIAPLLQDIGSRFRSVVGYDTGIVDYVARGYDRGTNAVSQYFKAAAESALNEDSLYVMLNSKIFADLDDALRSGYRATNDSAGRVEMVYNALRKYHGDTFSSADLDVNNAYLKRIAERYGVSVDSLVDYGANKVLPIDVDANIILPQAGLSYKYADIVDDLESVIYPETLRPAADGVKKPLLAKEIASDLGEAFSRAGFKLDEHAFDGVQLSRVGEVMYKHLEDVLISEEAFRWVVNADSSFTAPLMNEIRNLNILDDANLTEYITKNVVLAERPDLVKQLVSIVRGIALQEKLIKSPWLIHDEKIGDKIRTEYLKLYVSIGGFDEKELYDSMVPGTPFANSFRDGFNILRQSIGWNERAAVELASEGKYLANLNKRMQSQIYMMELNKSDSVELIKELEDPKNEIGVLFQALAQGTFTGTRLDTISSKAKRVFGGIESLKNYTVLSKNLREVVNGKRVNLAPFVTDSIAKMTNPALRSSQLPITKVINGVSMRVTEYTVFDKSISEMALSGAKGMVFDAVNIVSLDAISLQYNKEVAAYRISVAAQHKAAGVLSAQREFLVSQIAELENSVSLHDAKVVAKARKDFLGAFNEFPKGFKDFAGVSRKLRTDVVPIGADNKNITFTMFQFPFYRTSNIKYRPVSKVYGKKTYFPSLSAYSVFSTFHLTRMKGLSESEIASYLTEYINILFTSSKPESYESAIAGLNVLKKRHPILLSLPFSALTPNDLLTMHEDARGMILQYTNQMPDMYEALMYLSDDELYSLFDSKDNAFIHVFRPIRELLAVMTLKDNPKFSIERLPALTLEESRRIKYGSRLRGVSSFTLEYAFKKGNLKPTLVWDALEIESVTKYHRIPVEDVKAMFFKLMERYGDKVDVVVRGHTFRKVPSKIPMPLQDITDEVIRTSEGVYGKHAYYEAVDGTLVTLKQLGNILKNERKVVSGMLTDDFFNGRFVSKSTGEVVDTKFLNVAPKRRFMPTEESGSDSRYINYRYDPFKDNREAYEFNALAEPREAFAADLKMRLASLRQELAEVDAKFAELNLGTIDKPVSFEEYVVNILSTKGENAYLQSADGRLIKPVVSEATDFSNAVPFYPVVELEVGTDKAANEMYNVALNVFERYRQEPVSALDALTEEELDYALSLSTEMVLNPSVAAKIKAVMRDYIEKTQVLARYGTKVLEFPDADLARILRDLMEVDFAKVVAILNTPDVQKGMYIAKLENMLGKYFFPRTDGFITEPAVVFDWTKPAETINKLQSAMHRYYISSATEESADNFITKLLATNDVLGAVGISSEASPYYGVLQRYANTALRDYTVLHPELTATFAEMGPQERLRFVLQEGLLGSYINDKLSQVHKQVAAQQMRLQAIGTVEDTIANLEKILSIYDGRYEDSLKALEQADAYIGAHYNESHKALGGFDPNIADTLANMQLKDVSILKTQRDLLTELIIDPSGAGTMVQFEGYDVIANSLGKQMYQMSLHNPDLLARVVRFHSAGAMLFIHKGVYIPFDAQGLYLLSTEYGVNVKDLGDYVLVDARNATDALLKMGALEGTLAKYNSKSYSTRFTELMDTFAEQTQFSSNEILPFSWEDALYARYNGELLAPFFEQKGYLTAQEASDYMIELQESGKMGLTLIAGGDELRALFGSKLPMSPVHMAVLSGVTLAMHQISKPRMLNIFANPAFKIGQVFNTDDPAEAFEIYKSNPVFNIVVVDKDLQLTNLTILNPKMMKIAMDRGAVVMPYTAFVELYKQTDNFQMPKILDVLERWVTPLYNSAAMTSLGLGLRNLVDNLVKYLMWTKSFDSLAYLRKVDYYILRFNEMAREMGNLLDVQSVISYLRNASDEDVMVYAVMMQAKEVKASGVGMEVVFDIAAARGFLNKIRSGIDESTIVQQISWGNPLTKLALSLQNWGEQRFRLAAYLWGLDQGMASTEVAQALATYFFDYSFRGKGLTILKAVIPFSTFAIRNALLWGNEGLKNPWLLRLMLDISKVGWTDEEETDNDYVVSQEAAGNIKIGDTLVKLNPSLFDAIGLLPSLIDNPLGRINPVITNVSKFMSGDIDGVALPWETPAKRLSNMLIQAPEVLEGTRDFLPTYVPSVFGVVYTNSWTSYSKQPSIYSMSYASKMSGRYTRARLTPLWARKNFYSSIWSSAGTPRFASTTLRNRLNTIKYRYREINRRIY